MHAQEPTLQIKQAHCMYELQHRINTPRKWQDINKNNSLDPIAASNWRLSSIKRYNSESRPSTPPFQASRRLLTIGNFNDFCPLLAFDS